MLFLGLLEKDCKQRLSWPHLVTISNEKINHEQLGCFSCNLN
jgi:hypothetical protein